MPPGVYDTRFDSVSEVILDQADFRFASALEYSRIPSTLFMISLRIDQRFSTGFRSGELAGHNPLPQEVISWVYNHSEVVLAE